VDLTDLGPRVLDHVMEERSGQDLLTEPQSLEQASDLDGVGDVGLTFSARPMMRFPGKREGVAQERGARQEGRDSGRRRGVSADALGCHRPGHYFSTVIVPVI
jgi:hypothetical protein